MWDVSILVVPQERQLLQHPQRSDMRRPTTQKPDHLERNVVKADSSKSGCFMRGLSAGSKRNHYNLRYRIYLEDINLSHKILDSELQPNLPKNQELKKNIKIPSNSLSSLLPFSCVCSNPLPANQPSSCWLSRS